MQATAFEELTAYRRAPGSLGTGPEARPVQVAYADALASGSPERDFGERSDDDGELCAVARAAFEGMLCGLADALDLLGGVVRVQAPEGQAQGEIPEDVELREQRRVLKGHGDVPVAGGRRALRLEGSVERPYAFTSGDVKLLVRTEATAIVSQ